MWKREIHDTSVPIRMGQMSLRSLSEIERDRHSSNAFFVKDTVHIEGETSCYDSIADTGTVITRYFFQTAVAAFWYKQCEYTSSSYWQVHWTIVHGSNQMPLSIIKKASLGFHG